MVLEGGLAPPYNHTPSSEVALAEQPALWFWHLQNWKSLAPSLILV